MKDHGYSPSWLDDLFRATGHWSTCIVLRDMSLMCRRSFAAICHARSEIRYYDARIQAFAELCELADFFLLQQPSDEAVAKS